jgi:hypothetical protein
MTQYINTFNKGKEIYTFEEQTFHSLEDVYEDITDKRIDYDYAFTIKINDDYSIERVDLESKALVWKDTEGEEEAQREDEERLYKEQSRADYYASRGC